jgi:hypothetical protein
MKIKLFIMLALILLPGAVFAHSVNLQAEHGEDLAQVPFPIRYKFLKSTEVPWEDADFETRKAFLDHWYDDQEIQQQTDIEQARQEEDKRRQMETEKMEAQRVIDDRHQAQLQSEQDREQEEIDAKRQFDDEVRARKERIDELKTSDRRE